jgi:hypothetical protein
MSTAAKRMSRLRKSSRLKMRENESLCTIERDDETWGGGCIEKDSFETYVVNVVFVTV